MSTAMRHSRYMLLGIAFGYLLGILWWSDLRQITLFSQPAYSTPYHSLKSNRNCICDHCNANIGSSSMPENSGNKSLATLRLPPGISVPQTDLYRRRLWGNPSEDLPWKPRYLVTFTVGVEQKESINRAAKKFSRNFTVMLFHYDGKASEWDELEWSRQAIHVSAPRQTKWWFAKRFLHPDAVAPYDYIFIWDEDLGLENFDAEEYLRVVERHGLEISQPAVDTGSRGMGWTPVFSRKAWKCVWKMIQNDLVHGWGLDFKFHNCVGGTGSGDKAAHEIMGVVDSQWVVHRHLSSLGLVKSVYKRCLLEARLFSDRWDEADFEHVCCEEKIDIQRISYNSLKTHKIKEEEGENGQTSPKFNPTIAESMVTMRVNVERSSQISTKAEKMSVTMKENHLKQCFFHAIPLKKVTSRTFGCWTMAATIT